MHDILLTVLILFSGFVPVVIALLYSRRLLIVAKNLQVTSQEAINMVPKRIHDAMYSDKFKEHMQSILTNSMRGAYGKDVQEMKKSLTNEAVLQGLPPPVKKTISKGVEGFFEDYGMSKKTAKGIGAAIDMILSRPSKAQKEQQDASILKYAKELGYDPAVLDVSGPKV